MAAIRAFVGHSFLPKDEAVVREFTNYLNDLRDSLPSFMWDHAERAEPNTLSDKVLRIAKDKNLFIGICTKKENVVSTESLLSRWPFRSYLMARSDEYTCKTSDWVIQEIGMAIGMGMKTILLIEKGLRSPGGLQGNTEYIEFERDNPSRAFPKLLQMVGGLSPKETTALISSSAEQSADEASKETDVGQSMDYLSAPDASWGRRQFELAIVRAILHNDEPAGRRIDTAYKASLEATPENQQSWLAYIESAQIRFGTNGNLEKLIGLSKANPTNSKVQEFLARALVFFNEHGQAASTFIASAETANSPERAAKLLRSAIEELILEHDFARARELLERIRSTIGDTSEIEQVFLHSLCLIAKAEKDDQLLVVALERLVEARPDDTDSRFQAAFKHDAIGNNDLALNHYMSIPEAERSGATWNNLAVQLDLQSLSAKAVDAFTRSANDGETLAMSNLAGKLVGQGFLQEAKTLCDKAVNIEDYHNNINELLSRIKALPEEEDDKLRGIIADARRKADFYRRLGRAIVAPNCSKMVVQNEWRSDDCNLRATIAEGKVHLVGTFEREQSVGILSLVGALGLPPSPPAKIKTNVRYEGRFEGNVFFGKVNRATDGQSLIGSAGSEQEVTMVLSVDDSHLEVIEGLPSEQPRYYSITRLAPNYPWG